MRSLRALGHLNTATFSALQMMLFTLIPLLAEKTQVSLTSVVGSFSVGSFLFLWSSPFWSARSDSWGRLKVLSIGMAGLTISTGLVVFLLSSPQTWVPNSVILWLSRVLYGLTVAGIVPVTQALQLDLSSKKSALKSTFANSMSLNIGRALGPLYLLIGGGVNMLFVMQGAVAWSALLCLLNIALIGKSLPQAPKTETLRIASWFKTIGPMRSIFALALLFTVFIGILNFSLASVLKKTFELSSVDSSILMAQVLLGSALFTVLTQALGKFLFRNPWQGSLVVGVLGLLSGALLLGEMNSRPELWLAMGLLSVGIALLPPSYLSLIISSEPQDSQLGRRTGLIGAANTLGYTLGGLLAAATFKVNILEIETVLVILVLSMTGNIALLYRHREDSQEVAYVSV